MFVVCFLYEGYCQVIFDLLIPFPWIYKVPQGKRHQATEILKQHQVDRQGNSPKVLGFSSVIVEYHARPDFDNTVILQSKPLKNHPNETVIIIMLTN